MNKNKLKVYAPKAREEFIKVVSERAALYGITAKNIEPCEVKGDYAFISGKPFPKSIEKSRDDLIKSIESKGFTQVMEEVAYTWFNRFAAIRFMELHGYFTHGYRVLSHPQGHSEPEILEKAQYLERLDGLEKEEIITLKTAGDKDAELYRKLIIAQCNELHSAMPFLFERVDDPTELLLPDNLLNTDSVIRQMVDTIPEEDWKEVEIIGWLYQFYISEKKDSLMKAKKAYKTEDIPAVTQLFTPNWIVKYLVQNSLGAKWLATYPASSIKKEMEYYIEPAEQADEVRQQLKEITPDSLNPEELTVMDPACGSGHILVEAYDLLKEIYLERGYRPKDIPALILAKNLYGLEIDDRAAQLAGFALMMKARQDDRHIFEKQINPNITCLKSANSMGGHFKEAEELIELFDNAKTFGSLIRVPEDVRDKLPQIKEIADKKRSGDLFEQKDAEIGIDLLRQAELLSKRYDCVIANPPYMGGGRMNTVLKEFAQIQYPATKSDLFAMFIERGFEMAKDRIGYNAMITQQVWMFLSSYERLRDRVVDTATMTTMAHNGFGAFGADFGTTIFMVLNGKVKNYKGTFISLREEKNVDDKRVLLLSGRNRSIVSDTDFKEIPGSPIAYWVSKSFRVAFAHSKPLIDVFQTRLGMSTADNDRYLRLWHEISYCSIRFGNKSLEDAAGSRAKWFPYQKGGVFRKWYGNCDYVVNWLDDGAEIKANKDKDGRLRSHNYNQEFSFKQGVTWSDVTSGANAFRFMPAGFLFDGRGSAGFSGSSEMLLLCLGLLNSKVSFDCIAAINPTIAVNVGEIGRIPLHNNVAIMQIKLSKICNEAVILATQDYNFYEISWDFENFSLLRKEKKTTDIALSYIDYQDCCRQLTAQMKHLEGENNRIFIEAYGLQDELTPDVPIEKITLFANSKYRYKGDFTDEELETRFKSDTMKELLSYAVGCMMGRYSLDKSGLVCANSGNEGFDSSQYKTFPADDDGIVPITDHEWFDDDAACRFFRFIETAWDKKGLDANLDFIAEAIGRKASESSREAIRRYFVNDFYKDHCHTYKKRPIYWLFTSGKEKAFQVLVYLHRYNEGTLSRMRTEYVLPLQTKINRYIEHLEKDKDNAASTSAANKIQKEISSLLKQKDELIQFDERLRHYADMKIKLDLDDGVKGNYAKFGDLLSDVKKIAGIKEEKDESAD